MLLLHKFSRSFSLTTWQTKRKKKHAREYNHACQKTELQEDAEGVAGDICKFSRSLKQPPIFFLAF